MSKQTLVKKETKKFENERLNITNTDKKKVVAKTDDDFDSTSTPFRVYSFLLPVLTLRKRKPS